MAADMARSQQPVKIELEADAWANMGMTPWMSYKIYFPTQPLPPVAERPALRTPRLVVRPLAPSDLDAFAALRADAALQRGSTRRGRPDRDRDESAANLAALQAPHDARHWYWGAFLADTGELVGEGGIPDTEDQPTSGWARCEFLVAPAHQRQGLGTEMFHAVMDAWWALPRAPRRHQLLPLVAGDAEPGQVVTDCVEFFWEASNDVADKFVAKALGRLPISHEGYIETFDWREGREGELRRWGGTIAVNPRPVVP